MLHNNERYIQLNEHIKEAYYELGALYSELGDSPNNQYIKEAIDLVRAEKDKIIEEMRQIEDAHKTIWKRR
jgi:uncharacterized protein (DUF2164 family)